MLFTGIGGRNLSDAMTTHPVVQIPRGKNSVVITNDLLETGQKIRSIEIRFLTINKKRRWL